MYRELLTVKWLRSFWVIRCISDLRNLVSRNLATIACIERNGVKVGLDGEYSVYTGYILIVKWLRLFWGCSVNFLFSETLHLERGWS